MSDANPSPGTTPSFSFGRVLILALPLALVVWGAYKMYGGNVQQEQLEAEARGQRNAFSGLFGAGGEALTLAADYKDADGDLLADAPAAEDCIDPEVIKFSYVASSDSSGAEETWKELLAALQEKLGKTIQLVAYTDTGEQQRALKAGALHITAFGTGEVQGAVNGAGFIPLACFADQNGDYRYKMQIIVPTDSDVQKVDDLKGGRFTFVRPRSNSGCTAALVMLMEKHDLQPERDYAWGFSFGHEKSIHGIADNTFQAAAVASDILERMVASGDVPAESFRIIYESEPYPPGVVGYAYNLKPELRDGIRETLLAFDWAGTGLEKSYGASGAVKFAPVTYKEDWQGVRELRSAGKELLAQLSSD
jgi:phosphonate transport system substrate-binding protein